MTSSITAHAKWNVLVWKWLFRTFKVTCSWFSAERAASLVQGTNLFFGLQIGVRSAELFLLKFDLLGGHFNRNVVFCGCPPLIGTNNIL
jgi:hypothetical protein